MTMENDGWRTTRANKRTTHNLFLSDVAANDVAAMTTRLQHTRRYGFTTARRPCFSSFEAHFFRGFCRVQDRRCSHRTFDSEGEALNVFPLGADPVKRTHVPIGVLRSSFLFVPAAFAYCFEAQDIRNPSKPRSTAKDATRQLKVFGQLGEEFILQEGESHLAGKALGRSSHFSRGQKSDMSGRDLPSRFGAMGISPSPRHYEEGRRYDQHHRMAPQPQPQQQSQSPPVQTPPQHQQPLPPLDAPLGSNDRPMFPDARQNEISGGGGTSGAPTSRRRPLPPSLPHPYAYQEQQQSQAQHYRWSQSQPPLPSPSGGYPAESYQGALTPYDGDDHNGRSQFALSRPASHPYRAEGGERRMLPAPNNVTPPPDNSCRHHHYSGVATTRSQSHLHRSRPSPRSAHYEDDAYVCHQNHHAYDGDEYYYDPKPNSQNCSWQPHGCQEQQCRPAPSPRSRRRSSLEDFRDDDNERFHMERRVEPVPSSPAGRLASPRRRRQPPVDDTYDGYFGQDEDIDDNYRRRVVYSPSVESEISTRSAASRRQIRPNRSRHAAPPPSPRDFYDGDIYGFDCAPSRRDRSRASRNAPAFARRRLQDPFIVEEEEGLYDIVEVQYPSILRRSPKQLHADFERRVTFSPSTELPDEDSYASQRSIGSRSMASVSVAHGVLATSMTGDRTSLLETRRIQEESEARQQVVAEIRQAIEMRDSARDVRDIEFWERQIRMLNQALRKLGSSPRALTGLSDAYSGGRDLSTSSSWQSEETLSRTSAISGRSGGTTRGIRRGDEYDVAQIVSSIPAKNIKVRAPSNLNEGHQLTLQRGGETIVVTVPRGGVRVGEVFTVYVGR